jgi:nucleoprotein TPR
LREFIKKDKIQDEEARKILEDTQNKLKTVSEEKSNLQKELDAANATIGELNARISDYQQQIIQRDTDISRLKAEIHAQTTLNKTLTAKNTELEALVEKLQASEANLNDDLNRANARIDELIKTNAATRKKVTAAEHERDAMRTEVTAANEERDNAVTELEELKQKLYKKKIVLD